MKSAWSRASLIVILSSSLACGSVAEIEADASSVSATDASGVSATDARVGGTIDAALLPDSSSCPDDDGDTVCNADDICAGSDDRVDTDGDMVPDGCDLCSLGDDAIDDDMNALIDACEVVYGTDTDPGGTGNFLANFLLGHAITLAAPTTLKAFGVVAREAGPSIKLGLYSDSMGRPGTLVASTGATPLVVGNFEIPVADVSLPAGDYWIMGLYSQNASIGIGMDAVEDVHYIALPFADALPTLWPASDQTYTGRTISYYLATYQE